MTPAPIQPETMTTGTPVEPAPTTTISADSLLASIGKVVADALETHTLTSLLPGVESAVKEALPKVEDALPSEIHTLYATAPPAERPYIKDAVLGVALAVVVVAAIGAAMGNVYLQGNLDKVATFAVGLILFVARYS